jgi:hypothetical protein
MNDKLSLSDTAFESGVCDLDSVLLAPSASQSPALKHKGWFHGAECRQPSGHGVYPPGAKSPVHCRHPAVPEPQSFWQIGGHTWQRPWPPHPGW